MNDVRTHHAARPSPPPPGWPRAASTTPRSIGHHGRCRTGVAASVPASSGSARSGRSSATKVVRSASVSVAVSHDASGVVVDRRLEQVAGQARVAEAVSPRGGGQHAAQLDPGVGGQLVALAFPDRVDDGDQLVVRVVGEDDDGGEARPQPRVGRQQLVHLVGVSGDHDHDAVAPVLHQLHDLVDRLATEVVLATADQGVGLVDEQHPLVGLVKRRVTSGAVWPTAGDQTRSVGLDRVARRRPRPSSVIWASRRGDGRLAGARVASEHQVVRRLHGGQVRSA